MSGSIAGFVRDARGIPQMGASVFLFNRSERLIQQGITNERGIFGFEALTPDLYSVRVSLASFVPAMKQKIAVQPGMQSLLYVDLASVLSSIELVYAVPGQGALMSDDWKWTLKASSSTRPVLRMLPDLSVSDPNHRDHASGSVFSDTRGRAECFRGRSWIVGRFFLASRSWQPPSPWLPRCSAAISYNSAATSAIAPASLSRRRLPNQFQPRWRGTGDRP